MSIRIGVLALQGDFAEHAQAMSELNCEVALVKTVAEVESCHGLILPGGESTTIGKLCDRFGVGDAILGLHKAGRPLWGTCAGMILLAKEIVGSDQWRLGIMNIEVQRNAFGRQVDSFEADIKVAEINDTSVRGVFIRAPYVTRVWEPAYVMATFNDKIVMAREGNLLASAFHPELTDDRRVQEYFLNMVKDREAQS